MKSLSVQYKILLIPIVGVIGFLSYLAVTFSNMNTTEQLLGSAKNVEFPLLQAADKSLVTLDKIKETLGSAVTTGEAELLSNAQELANLFRDELNQVKALSGNNANKLSAILTAFDKYYDNAYELSKQLVDGSADFSKIGAKSETMNKDLAALQALLNAFQQQRSTAFDTALNDVISSSKQASNIGLILAVITVGILFAVAIPIANAIRSNLRDIIESMQNIAQDNGDLTVRLKTNSTDDFGDLVYWFNNFIEKLQGVISDVVQTALPLADTASKISELSNQSMQTFDNQKQSVEESQRSVEDMTSSVSSITANAANAADAALNANTEAVRGKEVVESTVEDIRELAVNINESLTPF